MSFFSLPPLISSALFLSLAIFVWSQNKHSPINRALALACLTTFGWQSAWAFLFSIRDPHLAEILTKIGYSYILFIPPTLYGFFVAFLAKPSEKKYVIAAYSFSAAALYFLWFSSYFINGYFTYFWGFYPRAGILHPVFLIVLIAQALRVFYLLLVDLKRQEHSFRRKNQTNYLIAALVAYTLASFDFLVNYGLEIYPFGFIAILITLSLITYAIIRHHLLNIELIIKKTVVFTGLFGALMAIVGIVTTLTQSFVGQFVGMGRLTGQVLSILIAMALFDPTRKLLVNLTDKFLFQKKYDYHKLLKDASRGMSNIESLDHLVRLVLHFVTMKMRVRNAAVLMRSHDGTDFTLLGQRGYDKNFLSLNLEEHDPLIDYLAHHREAVDIERIKERIETVLYKSKRLHAEPPYDYEMIRDRMVYLKASCCVPSFLGREMRGVLILGEKKSGQYYSTEDLNLLYTLAQESAIAIENAWLYDEAIRRSDELAQINSQLENSRMLLERALNEAEGANKQLQDAQAQLIHEQKMATLGRLAASVGHEVNNPLTILSMNVSRAVLKHRKDPNLKVSEIMEVFEKMEKNIERIKAVVNTLTGLLKKSEKGKFEPLSLKLILEETLPLVQFQTYLDNLTGTDVDFNVPGNIPLIRGDLERLQEVFLNMFINAYHAMAGKKYRKISVLAEIDPQDARMVAVHFKDNGSGMTEEVRKKIFNYGFTTKPPGKGSGLGLYMCKYIIELHGGTITVKSKVGEGTTFTLTLPIYEEVPSMKTVPPRTSEG